MYRKLVLATFALISLSSTGCIPELGHAADALDRFSKQIDTTASLHAENLRKLVDQTSAELRGLIMDAKTTSKEITADFMLQWATERQATFKEISLLSKQVFKDTDVLVRHFQAAGLSVPLQLGNELKEFNKDLQAEIARMLVMTPFGPDNMTLAGYSGLTWSERAAGHYEVTFQIRNAAKLQLSVGGGEPISPAKPPTGGEVSFRVPVSEDLRGRFDDQQQKILGFKLVEKGLAKAAQDLTIRYTGWAVLLPRFPVEYSFRVIAPGDGVEGKAQTIDQGPAIDALVQSAVGTGLTLATRHGALYRATKTHLPAGVSRVVIPMQATWELTVKFPDGSTEVLSPGMLRVANNSFGEVTVNSNQTDDAWTLHINVKPK